MTRARRTLTISYSLTDSNGKYAASELPSERGLASDQA